MTKGKTVIGLIGIIVIIILIIIFNVTTDFEESDPTSENISESDVIFIDSPSKNYPPAEREKFCGTGNAKSGIYIKEFKIPTECTQPQAITTDPTGNIWFLQSNTGKIAKFDTQTESFNEYDNPFWKNNVHSMMWGLRYSSDGSLWFTETESNSIWKFDIENETYRKFTLPSKGDSLLQRLEIYGSKAIVNDFTGHNLGFFDITQNDQPEYFILPSQLDEALSGGFIQDSKNFLWYTNWVPDSVIVDWVGSFPSTSVLIRINQTEFDLATQNEGQSVSTAIQYYPPYVNAPSDITIDDEGNIWTVDSTTSSFFKFYPFPDIVEENFVSVDIVNFTRYTTSEPPKNTYGNYSGVITSPSSNLYWIDFDSGNLIFNEQGSNRIGLFNLQNDSLVEYDIPSKNPHWGDCGNESDCGIAQVFDFTVDGEKIWFTEWAENNIGYVDTKVPLPLDIYLEPQKILLTSGDSKKLKLVISSNSQTDIPLSLVISNPKSKNNFEIQGLSDQKIYQVNSKNPLELDLSLTSGDQVFSGEYKVLLGASTDQVSVGKFLTIIVE